MTDVVCDASVVLKWFHEENEPEVEQALAIASAHRRGHVNALILDLTLHELGNVLLGSIGLAASAVAAQLDDLAELCPVVAPAAAERHLAAQLAERHRLTFYDALYAATAELRTASLATTDRKLLRAGLGETPTSLVERLAL